MRKRALVACFTAVVLLSTLMIAPGCGGSAGDAGQLPPGVQEILDSPEFAYSTWGIRVVDLESGEEIFTSLNPDIMLDPASTTKLFTVATGFDVLGSDYRFETPVYRQGEDGELFDLVEDPGEVNNLWHDPRAKELKAELLYRFMQATLAVEPTRMPRIAGA